MERTGHERRAMLRSSVVRRRHETIKLQRLCATRRILEWLELRSHWGGDDEIDTFNFTLPEVSR